MSHSILRIERIKSFSDTTGIQKHVQRETENYTNQDIEKEKTHMNFDFINSENVDFNEKVKDRIENGYTGKRKVRSDAIKLVDGIITSDSAFFDNMHHLDTEYFFEHTLEFLKEEFGEKNIMYATVHLDEKTPHMHFGFVPLTGDGRLSAKDVIGNKKQMSALQDKFNDFVNERGYNMQRGESAISSEREHQRVETFKKETDYHKKELNQVKSDLNRQFELLTNLNRNIPQEEKKKREKEEFTLPEVKKFTLSSFNVIKEEELAKLYETIDKIVEHSDKKQVELEDKDHQINDLKGMNRDLTQTLKQQQNIEAEKMTELNDRWEEDYKKLKEQHESLTHVTHEIIDEKAESLMEKKTYEIKDENENLKHEVSTLRNNLSQTENEKKELVTEKNALKSTISDMEERYQEMKTSFQNQISEIKTQFDDMKEDLTHQIKFMYNSTKVFIRHLKDHDFEMLFNGFRTKYDDDLHRKSKFENPDNEVEELVKSDEDEDVLEVELDLDLVREQMNFQKKKEKNRDDGMEM